MSTGAQLGENQSVTPADSAGITPDAGVAQTTPPDSTPATSPAPTAPPAVSNVPPKPENDAPDDPVRTAIDHLARDDRPRDDQGRFAPKSEKPADSKPVVPKKPEAPVAASKPEAPKPPDTSTGVDVDPYHGFDPREREGMRQRTRERVEDLHKKWRDAEAKFTELQKAPPQAQPDQLDALINEYKLEQDVQFVPEQHVAGLIASQAAVTRAQLAVNQGRYAAPSDLKIAGEFFNRIDEIRGQIGLAAKTPAPAELLPFAGQLPAELQDLVDVYGIPEARVRMLAALEGKTRTQSNQQQRPPATAPVAPPPAPAPQQQRGVGVDMNALWGQRLAAELTRDGVKPGMVEAHYQVLFPIAAQITQQRFPTVPAANVPDVFDALPPDQRYSIMAEAQRNYRASQTQASRPPAATPPPPATNTGLKGQSPRASAPASNSDPVQAALAFLSR